MNLIIGRRASVAHQYGQEDVGVPLAVDLDGRRYPLISNAAALFSLTNEWQSEAGRVALLPPEQRLITSKVRDSALSWLWTGAAESRSWSTLADSVWAPRGPLPLATLPEDWESRTLEVPDLPANRRAALATDKWRQFCDAMKPGWEWSLKSLASPGESSSPRVQATQILPPPDLPIVLARSAIDLPHPIQRSLGLAIALALGHEAIVLHAGWHTSKDDPLPEDRKKAWGLVARNWIDFLDKAGGERVSVRVRVVGESLRDRISSVWLPVGTLRGVTIRVGMGGKRREDFVTRFGLRAPWAPGWPVAHWLDESPKVGVVHADPWPSPLDHLLWWRWALDGAVTLLLADALEDPATPRSTFINLEIPWFEQALASTVAVSSSVGGTHGLAALHKAASHPPSQGSCPNAIHPEASQLIGEAYRPVRPGNVLPMPEESWLEPTRNLAADVDWGLKSLRRYVRLVRFEAEQIVWWHKILFPATCDLAFIHGDEWPSDADANVDAQVSRDAPPTSFIKKGWLRHVIALFARNGTWPGNMPVPGMAALEAVSADFQTEQDQLDIRVGMAGTPDEVEWFAGQATAGGWTALRWLSLAGWFLKPTARTRILQWLEMYPPRATRPPNWELVVASSAIAATRFVHSAKDTEMRGALERAAAAARGLRDDDRAVGLAMWLDRFLACTTSYPARPPRRE